MRTISVRRHNVSLRFFLIGGMLLVVGVAALGYFAQTGGFIRRHDPKAVKSLPAGIRPKRVLPKPTKKSQVEIVKHPILTTRLAHLARAVPQQRGPISQGQQIGVPAGFSVQALPKSVQDGVRTGQMRINKKAQVQLYILLVEMTEQNLQKLRAAGAIVELQDDRQRIVQARVPVARLEEVSALPFVQSIRLPDYGIPSTGSLTTEGDAILAADEVRSVFGVDGTGVRVGVISDGIAGIFDTGCTICGGVVGGPIETEDLPPQDVSENPTTGTRNGTGILTSTTGGLIAQSFRSDNDLEGGAEGTALLEIVHDLAPGAQLYFANGHTSLGFNQAVNFLAANTDVVVDDIGFVGLPYDGSSYISINTANALNNDANPIRAYFTSVGNFARKHYQEDFLDSGLDGDIKYGLGQPGNVHLFQATANTDDVMARGASSFDSVYLCGTSNPVGCSAVSPELFDTVAIYLVWDDVFGASGNDYDLFLLEESTGNVVASSTGPQDGDDSPRESIIFTNTGTEGYFSIVIQNFSNSAAPVNFDMFIPSRNLALGSMGENHNFNTVSSSVSAQSDAGGIPASVISVGAIYQGDIDIDDIEPFSSNGPTNDARLKPDATAIDGVSVTGVGGFGSPFFGTSAAAPHGAGVAALLLQLSPCFLDASQGEVDDTTARQSLRNLVLNNTVDLGVTGSDQEFGFGLIDSLASANQTVPTSNAGSDQTVTGTSTSGASVTLDGTGSLDPNICPLTFGWSGGCGTVSGSSKTLAVDCPFGVSTMNLTVTNNNVTLSTPDSVEITVTDFDVGVSPASASVSRGQSANYTVNLTPQFGSFDNPVSLSCTGLPASSSCSFSPAALTPGGSQATATLTVNTATASSSLWPTGNTSKGTLVYASLFTMPGLGLLCLAWVGWVPQKRRRPWLVLTALTFLLALYVSCGGGGGSAPPPNPGTPSETSTITITGASGSLQRSATVSLTVR